MPITTAVPVHGVDQETFHQVDKRVTGIAFDIHNEFGRFLDECLYQRELTKRCQNVGLTVTPELRITVSLDSFSKNYYADHLVDQGVIVETKTASSLTNGHRGQTLNYLFLCGLHHGTLLNFGTDRVQHEFVSTRLTPSDRRQYRFSTDKWKPITKGCHELQVLLRQILSDWGAYLEPALYRDALVHFLGGEQRVSQRIDVKSNLEVIGSHEVQLVCEGIAFSVTAATRRPESICAHQRRFLHHTDLQAIQWINLNHSTIEFQTIERV